MFAASTGSPPPVAGLLTRSVHVSLRRQRCRRAACTRALGTKPPMTRREEAGYSCTLRLAACPWE